MKLVEAVVVLAAPVPPAAVETVTESVSVPAGKAETLTPPMLCEGPEMVPEPVTEPEPPLEVMV